MFEEDAHLDNSRRLFERSPASNHDDATLYKRATAPPFLHSQAAMRVLIAILLIGLVSASAIHKKVGTSFSIYQQKYMLTLDFV